MEQFSYIKGTSKYIDHLCDSNKLTLLSDTKIINEELKPLYEEALQFPMREIIVLFPGSNISHLAFQKVMNKIGPVEASSSVFLIGEDAQYHSFQCLVHEGKAIYVSPMLIIPWQYLVDLIKDFDIVTLFDPLQI